MLFKIIKSIYLFFNILVILALLAIHFVLKENSYASSLLFYSYPLPIIIFIIVFLSIFLGRFSKINLGLAVVLSILWFGRSFKLHFPESIKETDTEIVFWNASRDKGFAEAFTLNDGIPDIMVLTEATSLDTTVLKTHYPEYHFYKSATDMVVFSKTPIHVQKEDISKYHSHLLFFKSKSINFCAIDVQGSTDVPRSWEFGFVNNRIENNPNTVILGDFNVPFESKYLDGLKQDFNHAFSKKGNGFKETWFWVFPLLSLDHIWVSKDLKILKTEKIHTFKSDHNMIKTFIR
ncbi:hypothetical protein GSB9_02269 [Flavobacteriaceae bacterium GSB9]|nr:hypothetical protein GSB9_02269 [Flavobacteriaceae bacterium GSB9]